jgi:putative ABC transport system permease protein
VLRDLYFTLRIIRKNPAFAIVIFLSLSLGIAATTTIFSVIYAVLLAPPLYKDASRLVVLWESNPLKGMVTPVAPATFRDWLERSHSFEGMELVAPGSPVTVTGSGLPERANIQYATPGLFPLLGIQPVMGRSFTADENKSVNPIILSYGFWSRHFGRNSDIIGRQVTINGTTQTIYGVLPRDFHLFDQDTDLWMPIDRPGADARDRAFRSWLIAIGKLRPGVPLRAAQTEMNFLSDQIATAYPATNKNWGVKIEPVQNAQFGYWKPILQLLIGIVAFVLLISCANVANLFLGHLTSRSRELCVRTSLGANRARIIRQLLTEGLLLGVIGGACGWLLSHWGIALFRSVAPADFPLLQTVQINLPAFFFCLGISLLSGVAASLIPAYFASRLDIIEVLKSTAQTTVGRAYHRYRNGLIVAQIALSLVLLFGAGLMINSMSRLLRVDPGFRPQNVVTMQMFLAGPKYFDFAPAGVTIHNAVGELYTTLLDRVSVFPGVQSAAVVSWLPDMGYNTGRRERAFQILGQHEPAGRDASPSSAAFNAVSAGYFPTLQIPLLRGRNFDSRDRAGTPWVAIVNQAFVRRYCVGDDPLGKQLRIDDAWNGPTRQIIGVVANVRQNALDEDASPEIFVPFMQQPNVTSAHGYQNRVHMTLVVRTTLQTDSAVTAVRTIAAELDGSQPVFGVRTMPEVLADSTSVRRLYAKLLEILAAMALFLSAIGIYGVMSHSVSQRVSEIGLRVAIGATRADVLRLIFSQGARLTLAGLAIGFVCALLLARSLASYLYNIDAHDPATMVVCCVVLITVAIGATWVPAYRATQVDPIVILRSE